MINGITDACRQQVYRFKKGGFEGGFGHDSKSETKSLSFPFLS